MLGQLTNHLWQSTWFALAAGLLTVAFRKNRARVRYWIWFSASLKFLVPFWLLISLGSRMDWAPKAESAAQMPPPPVSLAMVQISQPTPARFPQPSPVPVTRQWAAMAIPGVWALGFAGVAWIRFRGWRRIRRALRTSTPSQIPAAVEVRFSPGLLEPGVVGLVRPVLLLPTGIEDYLTPPQLAAVLAHELCHVQRRDNLLASIHMMVEALFWFHPLVWWIGARLLEERERACDEEVLRLGSQPHVYAQGIVSVCKLYVKSPLVCVSGVTGSDLKRRIEAIMTNRILLRLNLARKAVLAVAGICALAVPIAIGIMNAPYIRAQAAPAGTPKFETVSIQPGCAPGASAPPNNAPMVPNQPGSPATLDFKCVTVANLLRQAYGRFASGRPLPETSPLAYVDAIPISGGPAWIYTDGYRIQAKAPGDPGGETILGPMMQALLEDRFQVKVRRETREAPAYALTVAAGGAKMRPYLGDCISNSVFPLPAGQKYCSQIGGGDRNEANFSPRFAPEAGVQNLDEFSLWLFIMTDRPVLNKTGLSGRFFMHFLFAPDQTTPGALNRLAAVARRHGGDAGGAPSNPAGPSLFTALPQELGLQLEPITASRDVLLVDRAERPAAN